MNQAPDLSTSVVSVLGAVISVVTLTLLALTAYLVYRVYIQGKLQFTDKVALPEKQHAPKIEESIIPGVPPM